MRIEKVIKTIDKGTWIVFLFFAVTVFFVFRDLFNSYFVADEWFHFTHYLPLTKKSEGLFTAMLSPFISTGELSGGQHVNPIASSIFFLNSKLFGMNYVPYAVMSLLLHAVNSFLVFRLILLFLKNNKDRVLFALSGGVFFAFAPTPLHTVTGAAPFYGENVLSVTFVLFSILLLKLAYSFKNKKYLYLSLLSLFGAVFSKETAGYLFLLLPILVFIEERVRRNRTFSLRFLSKLFVFCLILYVVIRFVIPGIGNLLSGANKIRAKAVDTGTIVSRDLSIHKNLPLEIVFRTITYPIRMTGTVFVPRDTVVFMVEALAPIVRPTPSGGDRTGQVEFILGSGPYTVIYLFSIGMLIYIFLKIKDSLLSKKYQESAALVFGIGTIFLASLPLVVIIFAFPRWGYDSYFDGRHYYHPTIGAAIIFPFLLEDTSRFISKIFKSRVKASATFVGLFLLWLINNMFIFNYNFGQIVNKYNGDRREVLVQLKKHLPVLPKKVAFYFETDGNSIYGPILPFQTSVPQAISVYYYKTSPLPNSFFENTILNGKAEGYQVAQGQGFGYYMNKDKLAEDLSRGEFQVSNIYAYHYKAGEVRLLDISQKIRSEMADYLVEAEKTKDWKLFKDKIQVFSFLYPPEAIINQEDNTMTINITHPSFSLNLFVTIVSPGFNANEYLQITSKGNLGIVNSKKVSYDKFHSKDAVAISENGQIEYLIQLTDKLIVGETDQKDNTFVEKILGSIVILTK